MSGGFEFLAGGPFQGPDDIIIDEYYARQKKVHVGDSITDLLNHHWRVSGVVEAGKLSHLSADLRRLQDLTGNTGKVSQILRQGGQAGEHTGVVTDLKDDAAGLHDLLDGGIHVAVHG